MTQAKQPVRDSSPLQSRKFLAYLISEFTSKILIGIGLFMLRGHFEDAGIGMWWWMITLTICVTFLEVGAILGISFVDAFVHTAQALAGALNRGVPEDKEEPTDSPV